ncbi:MAG: hypothetical protein ACLF0G_09290 [Candidatus Brocadiia bacterium]
MAVTTRQSRCLLCSLCCPVGLAFEESGTATPEYPGHAAQPRRGLCYRGHFLAELVGHPSRLHEATVRDGERARTAPAAHALSAAAQLLPAQREGLAVLLDGNLPCEELAAAVTAARQGLDIDRVAVFLPPVDEAVLRGLAATGAATLAEGEVAECDVLLAIGDPAATHPVIAGPVLDAVHKAREHRLLNIDCLRGRTARFATDFCQVRVGGEAAALAGILGAMDALGAIGELAELDTAQAAQMAGADPGTLEAFAKAIGGAKKLGVLIALPEGRCPAPGAVGALAGTVAQAKKGGVAPLCIYGNAVGAWRLAAGMGTVPLRRLAADAASGKVASLCVLGTDVVSALPGSPLAALPIVLAASPLATATTARARVVVPMAFGFELDGTVLDGVGAKHELSAAAAPPRGAMAPSAILGRLGGPATAPSENELTELLADPPQVGLAEALGEPGSWAPQAPEGQAMVVARADGWGFADGSVSGHVAWCALIEPQTTAHLNPEDAPSAVDGTVVLRGEDASVTIAALPNPDVPRGVAAVSPHLPETRSLFARAEMGIVPGPVTLEKSGGNDR